MTRKQIWRCGPIRFRSYLWLILFWSRVRNTVAIASAPLKGERVRFSAPARSHGLCALEMWRKLCSFLAFEAAAMVSGATLVVDGAMSIAGHADPTGNTK